jgi:poly-gamma-glutamate system protein
MRQSLIGFAWPVLTACTILLASGGASSQRTGPAPTPAEGATRAEDRAAGLMARCLDAIRGLRLERELRIDPALDPNGTGIIGDEFTPLTTSLGDVEAKRTTTNPAFAGLMVKYFRGAGLEAGDVVAIGASGSFPALLLATLSAARVLDLEPVVIYSVGSSMYGANLPGFTFVDMLDRLRDTGHLPYRFAAVSPGGDGDRGAGVLFDEDGAALMAEARQSGLPVIESASLAANIQTRLRVYEAASRGRPIRCFVNIGGASASFGDTEASLALPNGLVRRVEPIPDAPTRGVVFELAARGMPIVHLLHVRGLARDNNLPFDPVPLPGPFGSRGNGDTR